MNPQSWWRLRLRKTCTPGASGLCPQPLSLPGSRLPSPGSATPRHGDSLARKPGFKPSLGRHGVPSLDVTALQAPSQTPCPAAGQGPKWRPAVPSGGGLAIVGQQHRPELDTGAAAKPEAASHSGLVAFEASVPHLLRVPLCATMRTCFMCPMPASSLPATVALAGLGLTAQHSPAGPQPLSQLRGPPRPQMCLPLRLRDPGAPCTPALLPARPHLLPEPCHFLESDAWPDRTSPGGGSRRERG